MTSSIVKTKDGVEIFYKDWGPKDAQPIVFHHGWPLCADDWDAQMLFFLGKGYRVVAHDRRGHGRSSPGQRRPRHGPLCRRRLGRGRASRSEATPSISAIPPAAARSRAMSPGTGSRRAASPRRCWSAPYRR